MRFIRKPAWIRKYLEHGDTIVEVMISMAVLAVVVGAAYAAATKAFDSSLNSQYRDQGVSYAQQQLELLKEADNSVPSNISMYNSPPSVRSGVPFCIDSSTKSVNSGSSCVINKFTIDTVYDSSAKEYQVTVSWPAATGTTQKTILFYKPNDSFAGTVHACTLIGDPGCTSTITNPPSVFVSAALPNPIGSGVTDNITWGASNIKTGSCTAAGPGTFASSVNSNADPGTYPFSTSTQGTYNFQINCKDAAGNTVSGATTVTVSSPPPAVTINSFTVSPASVADGGSATITWSSSNATSCTGTGFNTGGRTSSGASPVSTGSLSGPGVYSYSVTCNGPGGSANSGTQSVTVAAPRVYQLYICSSALDLTGCGGGSGWVTGKGGHHVEDPWSIIVSPGSGGVALWDGTSSPCCTCWPSAWPADAAAYGADYPESNNYYNLWWPGSAFYANLGYDCNGNPL